MRPERLSTHGIVSKRANRALELKALNVNDHTFYINQEGIEYKWGEFTMVESLSAGFSPSPLHSDYFAQSHLNTGEEESKVNGIADKVHLSREGIAKSDKKEGHSGDQELSEEQKKEVQELKKRDQEVKAHERAHMASGAGLVQGGASYEYTRGPDGKLYAVGGEVKIDVSAERDPDQTIQKMAQVKQAALAPAEPSGQDRAVAAQAAQIQAQAQAQKREEAAEELEENSNDDSQASPSGEIKTPLFKDQKVEGSETPVDAALVSEDQKAEHQKKPLEENPFKTAASNGNTLYPAFQAAQIINVINISA